jgi:hypothetical protein
MHRSRSPLLLIGLFRAQSRFCWPVKWPAYFQAHFPESFWVVVNQRVGAVLYCFIWLYVSAADGAPGALTC